jgi:hypothetical protein
MIHFRTDMRPRLSEAFSYRPANNYKENSMMDRITGKLSLPVVSSHLMSRGQDFGFVVQGSFEEELKRTMAWFVEHTGEKRSQSVIFGFIKFPAQTG